MRKKLTYILMLAFATLAVTATYANEGPDQYPNGAENWFAGAIPPKGGYLINYLGYYHGGLRDGSGHNVLLNGTTPSVNAEFNAFRWVQVTPFKVLGADYAMHIIVPVVNQSMNLGGKSSELSAGDITIDPFILGWHKKQLHIATGLDINLPTGHYDKADPRVSIGAHYYSFEPILALTYNSKSAWELSSKFMFNAKTSNNATDYHSGSDFHMDYLVGKHLGSWNIGASGYFLKQVTDDKVAGQVVAAVPGFWDEGRRGQVIAIGPSLGYTNKRHVTLIGYWQHETLVRNRFGGDKVWFKMIIPAGSLLPSRKS